MTDGDDTCECHECFWDGGDCDDDDDDRVQLRRSDTNPNLQGNYGGEADIRAFNAGLKGKIAYERMNPDPVTDRPEGRLGTTFVIGMGLSGGQRRRANHLAWEASGASYGNPNAQSALFADSEDELVDALRDAFGKIGVPDTEVTLGSSIVGSVKELIPQIPGLEIVDPVTSAVRPATPGDVIGDLGDLGDVNHARELRSKLRNNVLFTTTVETPGFRGHLRAYNVYRVQDFGTDIETRPLDLVSGTEDFVTQFWDAGELLRDRDPDERTILFNRRGDLPGTFPESFEVANVTATELGVGVGYLRSIDGEGASCDTDAAKIVVNVIRGWRLVLDPVNGLYPDNTRQCGTLEFTKLDVNGLGFWKFFDPSNVGPTVVQNPPRSPDNNPLQNHRDEYGHNATFPDGFYWRNLNRQTLVYLSANGGMVHAFRADSGAELFAYISEEVIGNWVTDEIPNSRNTLKDLVELIVAENNGIQNHRFFIASSATVEDVFLNSPEGDDDWHTALAFGRGAGGKFLTAIDVSNVGDWDGNRNNIAARLNPADQTHLPELRFNVGNRQGVEDLDVNGWSYDGLGETWSIPVMGNVRALNTDDQWLVFVGAGYGCRDDVTNEGQFFYILKMEDGSIYREPFQVPNDDSAAIDYNGLVATPTLYNATHLDPLEFDDYVTRAYIGDLQGYVHKLDCSQPDPLNWTFEQFADLGRDQPITAAAAIMKDWFLAQTIYVFVGTGGDQRVPSGTQFKFAGFIDGDAAGANSPGQPIQVAGGDFVIDLPAGERVFVAPVIGGQSVFFASTRQNFDINDCQNKFFSTLYEMGATTGLGTFDMDTTTAGDQSSLNLGEGKVTGLFFRDDHLYVSMSGGLNTQGETLVIGSGEIPPDQGDLPGTIQILVRGFRLSSF